MLENISLIASVICALTAITTSLRAIGTAREYSRHTSESKLKSGCRIGNYHADAPPSQRSSLKLHFIVTIIWITLSIIFIYPVFINKWGDGDNSQLAIFITPYLILAVIIVFIWRKVLQLKG